MSRLARLYLFLFSCFVVFSFVDGYDCKGRTSLDEMALNYVMVHENASICMQFSSAIISDVHIKRALNEFGILIYQKEVMLTKQGVANLSYLFSQAPFRKKNYARLVPQGFDTDASAQRVSVYLFEVTNSKASALLHEACPSLLVVQSHEQTMRLAQLFFNTNSIHHLNYAQKRKCKQFDDCIEKFGAWLEYNNYNRAFFCVDSDAVLAAYGLRDCSEISFLYHGNEPLKASLDGFFCNNEHAGWYPECLDDILFNPSYHFWYKGIKFASLNVVRTMKMAHDGLGNWSDVALIDSLYHD